jgi:hypothetical protein
LDALWPSVARDPRLVGDMRNGRQPRPDLARRIEPSSKPIWRLAMRFDFRHDPDLIRLFQGHARRQPGGAGALGRREKLRPRSPAMRLLDTMMTLAGPRPS